VPDGIGVARGAIVRVRLANAPRRRRRRRRATPDVERERVQPIDDVVRAAAAARGRRRAGEFVASYYREPIGLALALACRRSAAGRGAARSRRPNRWCSPRRAARRSRGARARARRPRRCSRGSSTRGARSRCDSTRCATPIAARSRPWRAEGWVEEPAPARARAADRAQRRAARRGRRDRRGGRALRA
jgi:hypothetical protein